MPEGDINLLADLARLHEECGTADWDGYDARPVTGETRRQAERFLKALSAGCPPPSLGAIPCGSITFEWYREPYWTLTVSVTNQGQLHYAALLGEERACGTIPQFDEMPPRLVDLINRVWQT